MRERRLAGVDGLRALIEWLLVTLVEILLIGRVSIGGDDIGGGSGIGREGLRILCRHGRDERLRASARRSKAGRAGEKQRQRLAARSLTPACPVGSWHPPAPAYHRYE